MRDFIDDLRSEMHDFGFRPVENSSKTTSGAVLILKRQTLNMNRAVVVLDFDSLPGDLTSLLKVTRRQVAFRCRFFPIFWGIGIQVVVIAPGLANADINPQDLVAQYDNQWAIVQSLFLVDPEEMAIRHGGKE